MVHYPRDELSRGLIGHWKLDDLKRVATDGIIAHYKMNDNAASTVVIDSKSGNNGTAARNTSLFTTASGKIGRALDFNGSSDRVTFAFNSIYNTGSQITICFWVKVTDFTSTDGITSHRQDDSTNVAWDIFSGITNNRMRFRVSNDGTSTTLITNNTDLSNATFYHVACVANGTDIRIYINGTLDSTPVAFTGNIFASPSVVLIGNVKGSSFLDGIIDDFRIYDRGLSLSEVQTIYNSNSGTETTELFRDTVTAIDRANFNDGTITGATNADGQNWKPSNSMSFDGVDDFVEVPHDANQLGVNLTEGFTISAWIKPETTGAGVSTDSGYIYDQGVITQTGVGVSLRKNNGHLQFWVLGGNKAITGTAITLQTWTHILVTASNTNPSLGNIYLNGILTGDANQNLGDAIGNMTTTNDPRIGNRSGGIDRTFDGMISKVKMWNRVLTKGEIKKLYRLRK